MTYTDSIDLVKPPPWPLKRGESLTGAALSSWIDEQVLPYRLRRWDRRVGVFERPSILLRFAEYNSRARSILAGDAPQSMTGNLVAQSVVSRNALERAVALDAFGSRRLSEKDAVELINEFALINSLGTWSAIAALQHADDRVAVHDLGVVEGRIDGANLVLTYEPQAFDFVGYQVLRSMRLDDTRDALPTDFHAWLVAEMKGEGEASNPKWSAASKALEMDTGVPLADLFDVLLGMPSMALGPSEGGQPRVGLVRAEDLHNLILDQAEPARASNVLAGLNALTFRGDLVDCDALDPTKLRWQQQRLVTRPFIRSGPYYVISEALTLNSLMMYAGALDVGDWPVAASIRRESTPAFHAAIQDIKRARGSEFEQQVAHELDRVGYPNKSIQQGKQFGSAVMRREIDHVAVDVSTNTIWLLEDKDVYEEGTLLSIRSTLQEFLKPNKGYVAKVLMSIDDVQADPAAVAAHVLGQTGHAVPDGVKWNVRAGFVLRDLGPMALVDGLPCTMFQLNTVGNLGVPEDTPFVATMRTGDPDRPARTVIVKN